MNTILIIEDDVRIQKTLHRLFTSEGYETKSSSEGSQGLETFRSISPDAVVLDLILPGMSGREVSANRWSCLLLTLR